MANNELLKYLSVILKKYNLCDINECSELKIGFNRAIFDLNDKFVLKICINQNEEQGVRNEISFLKNNSNLYCPNLWVDDDSKQLIPYVYTIEEKIKGQSLFNIWGKLNYQEKRGIVLNLAEILKKIHSVKCDIKYNPIEIIESFDNYLEKCIEKNIFSKEEIAYFGELKQYMKSDLEDARYGFIHGDIHFNNIILSQDGLKLIDFECYTVAPIDKEFDIINRMIRKPGSFIMNGESGFYYDPNDYLIIMDLLKEFYPEICCEKEFENRLMIYDCLNSMKWISKFPDYQLYNDILLEKSKKLIKK